jgi:FMN-dependent NADH-azoreductase
MSHKLLRIDASANPQTSSSKQLADHFEFLLKKHRKNIHITHHDISRGIPQIDSDWIAAAYSPDEERSDTQRQILEMSDSFIDELISADQIVLSTPMYNFSVPASLKAWIDLIARAGKTFQYTAEGPRGLLADKPVIILVSTGGVPVKSGMDYLTGYLEHIFKFIGITNITVIAADRMNVNSEDSLEKAKSQIERLFTSQKQAA